MDANDYNRLRELASTKLNAQASRAALFQSYYDNEAGIITLMDTEERRTFKTFLAESSEDWCALVVNAVAERLKVTGFRFGSEAASDAAWAIWQANGMDADSLLVQADALTMSSSFLLVQADDDNPTGVSMCAESPMQATVLYEPGSRRKRLAGYKRYAAEADIWAQTELAAAQSGAAVEVLILPDEIITWNPGDSRDRPLVEPNPAGVVGLVEVVPQPRTIGPPRSELGPAMSTQDRINTTIFARMVATDFGAFRTIWATGVKIARNVIKGEDGDVTQVVPPFQLGANRLLTNEDPAGRFGGIPESTLSGYLSSVSQDVDHLAAITQTPPHYLLGTIANLSADAIKAAETGLVAKCVLRSLFIGESYEEAMRIALALTGNAAATDTAAEVVWADMETRSMAQLVDALSKLGAPPIGVPQQVLWEQYGASPQTIDRWKALKAAEPPPPVPPAPPEPAPEPVPPEPVPVAG